MTNYTKQLPAFSRQQVLHAAPLDVNELLTEMTGTLDRLIGATSYVALALAPNLSLALADRGQLEQVVMSHRGLPLVEKPFTVAEFVRRVREALDRE